MIDDFIKQATSQLGISEQSAKQATGGVLGLLKQNSDGGQFGQLMSKIPGADQLVSQFGNAAAPAQSSGGGLGGALGGLLGGGGSSGGGGGGLMGMAAGLLGNKAGGAGQLLGILGNSGISPDKGMNFAGMLMGFLKQKGGADLLGGVLKNFPDLAKLIH